MSKNFETRVISLVNQVDRRNKIISLLDGPNLNWSFYDAISGKDIDAYLGMYDKKRRLRDLGYDLRANEIACFISHRKVWEECVSKNVPFLILEDDVKISERASIFPEIFRVIDLIIKTVRKDFLFVRLGNTVDRKFQAVKNIAESVDLVRYHRDPLGAFSYVLSPDVAKKLLRNSAQFSCPVDNYMWRGWEHGVCLFDLSPNLFFTSDIDTPSNIGDRSKPEISFLHKLRREYFRAFNKFVCSNYEKKITLDLKNNASKIFN